MAVKVTSRFATAMDTANILGVPRRRALELIKLVDSIRGIGKNNGVVHEKKKSDSIKRKLSKRRKRAKSSKAAR
jgi:hypothetical protein